MRESRARRDFPQTMSIAAARMSAIPRPMRAVKASPKTVTPITIAVRGSSAPMTAVGVEPISRTATAMSASEMTVETSSRKIAPRQAVAVVSRPIALSASASEYAAMVAAQKTNPQNVSFAALMRTRERLTTTM